MTTEQDPARLIAERIARRVSASQGNAGSSRRQGNGDVVAKLAAMHASLDSLRQELAQLESRLTRDNADTTNPKAGITPQGGLTWSTIGSARSSGNSSYSNDMFVTAAHPSQERFGVEEATVSELVDFFEGDKKCDLEPGGKTCDHCAMCSSRGF